MLFKKILAIKLRALGDTVLMTAPLGELRKAYPEAQIHVLVLKPWSPILEAHPSVDRVWTYERHPERTSRAKALARIAYRLRQEKFDCVVNFHASPSSSMLAFATGSKTRSIHYHGHRDKNRYSTVEVPGKGTLKPIIERDMDAVRALGLNIPAGRLPKIAVPTSEASHAKARIEKQGLPQPVLGIGLGTSRPTKAWLVERYAALAVAWVQKRSGSVIALAGPDEDERIHQFLHAIDDLLSASVSDVAERAKIRSLISAENHLPLKETAALLSNFSVFAGNDSGPRHIAVAVGTPTVTVFGPEHPFEWHPYPTDLHPRLFSEDLPCRKDADQGMPPWCALENCIIEEHRCMKLIGVDAVLQECFRVAR